MGRWVIYFIKFKRFDGSCGASEYTGHGVILTIVIYII